MTAQQDEKSIGELVSAATRDLSQLVRSEIALAKSEIKQEVKQASAGAAMFTGAALAGYLTLLFLSFAAAWGIGTLLGGGTGWGLLIVGVLYGIAAAVMALTGKKKVSQVKPPERTIRTVKDDLAWARHPTRTPRT